MHNVNLKLWGTVCVLSLLIVFQACKKDDDTVPAAPDPVEYERGDIVKVTSLGIYSKDMIKQIVDESSIDFTHYVTHSVEVLSVQYYTVDHKDKLILASGAIFVPQNRSSFPLMSIQHGTETRRDLVASVDPENSSEGKIALLTASIDYVTLVPDYPGFGVSTDMHPYLHANSLVPSVIDFITAGKDYCQENNILLKDELYLSGYSEGGYVTLMTQKALEEDYDMEITAVAPLSGPYDLKGTYYKIFKSRSYSTPAYVAYFLSAYDNIYGWNNIKKFLQEPYASRVEWLFNGTYSWGEVTAALPETMDEMLQPNIFLDLPEPIVSDVDLKSSVLVAALCDNTCLDWTPQAPLHFFHGDCDDIVFCSNATKAVDAFNSNGATDVQLTLILGGDHETTGTKALDGALAWFQSFRPDQK